MKQWDDSGRYIVPKTSIDFGVDIAGLILIFETLHIPQG